MEERLQKYLANNGVAARRKCEEFIQEGRVKVNGQVVKELGTKINPEKDIVEFDGKVVKPVGKKVYILLNKPIGYVTTVKDQFERPTVLDLVKVEEKVLPVGRLDMYTSGALILSNDGEFINKVTHPRNEVEKTYTVTVKGIVTKEDVEKLQNGVEIQMSNDQVVNRVSLTVMRSCRVLFQNTTTQSVGFVGVRQTCVRGFPGLIAVNVSRRRGKKESRGFMKTKTVNN